MDKPHRNHGHHISFRNAWDGLFLAVRYELNMKIILFSSFLSFLFAIFFNISYLEWIVLILTNMMVYMAEMINSSVEAVCDLVTDEWHKDVKNAKDIAAGCVLLSCMFAFLIGCVIFIPKLINILTLWLN